MHTTILRAGFVFALIASALVAQTKEEKFPLTEKVEALRRSIFGDEQITVITIDPNFVDEETKAKRAKFKEGLQALHEVHGPKGKGPRLHCGPILAALAGDDGGLDDAEILKLTESVLADDPECWGVVYLLERLGGRNDGMNGLVVAGTSAALAATRPQFDEIDPKLLAFVLEARGRHPSGVSAKALDLLLARFAAAFGSVTAARDRALEITKRPECEGRDAVELRRFAANIHFATDGQPNRSTWPDSSRERQGFRRLWQALLRENLRIETGDQRAALLILGRVMPAIEGLMARARGEKAPMPTTLKDDESGRLLSEWLSHVEGENDAWSKRLATLKRAKIEGRLETIDLLYDFGLIGADLVDPLVDIAAQARDWRLKSMALRTLAFQSVGAWDKRMARMGNDKTWQVRLSSAEALGAFRCRESIDELVDLLKDDHLRVRASAAAELAQLTGVALGTSAKRWKTWLAEKGPDWQLPDAATARKMRGPALDDERYARYFDLVVPSSHVVFVLDKSESMYWGLWDGAVGQVEQFLAESGPTTFFGIVEYDDDARLFKKTLMAANPGNLKKAISFLVRGKPTGATNVIDSLKLAFTFNDCDAVVLLSDGLPNRGKPSAPDGIIDTIVELNRYDRIALHTVQMMRGRVFPHDASDADMAAPINAEEAARRDMLRASAGRDELGGFLKRLARLNDGDFALGFGDMKTAPPGTRFGPGTDR